MLLIVVLFKVSLQIKPELEINTLAEEKRMSVTVNKQDFMYAFSMIRSRN